MPALRRAVTELDAQRDATVTDASSDDFLRDALGELIVDIGTLDTHVAPTIRHKLRWAQQVHELSVERYRAAWQQARRAILTADGTVAHTLYAEQPLELSPQVGLVPIGVNPVSKLWEFYDLRSAWDPLTHPDPAQVEDFAIPSAEDYDAAGNLPIGAASGVVLVLIPGTEHKLGNYGRDMQGGQAVDVVVPPFFIGKYELTQEQWRRLSFGSNPSRYKKQPEPLLAYPVEKVSWIQCHGLLRASGLRLPTDEQWEAACRAGTTTLWSCGDEMEELQHYGNVLDRSAEGYEPNWGRAQGGFDDGHVFPAPVGSYRPNPWGLFDMHGNVAEWTSGPAALEDAPDAGSGRWLALDRTQRGGAYNDVAIQCRSGRRNPLASRFVNANVGLRSARSLRDR